MDGTALAVGADQLATAQHPQVPAEPGLAHADRIGQFLHRDLGDAGKHLQDPQACDTGQGLIVGAELAQRRVCDE